MRTIWQCVLRPGEKWSGAVSRNRYLCFKALGDEANLALLFYNLHDHSERYNMPDTLKAQYTAHLTAGNVLMSDNGRVLASIVEDSLGWHDTITGLTTRALTDERYGPTSYQKQGNDWLRSGYENVAVELMRNNMTLRDLVPCVNLFSKVYVNDDGSMVYEPGWCREGATVTLRTEMDVTVILSNTPNPLNPTTDYPAVPVQIVVREAPPAGLLDVCVQHRSENHRAFENTWEYHALLGSEQGGGLSCTG
jgi:urea carboxylase-associated protein 2